MFKKDDPLGKENYKPVSILPLISKVYEKLLYNQLSDYCRKYFQCNLLRLSKSA